MSKPIHRRGVTTLIDAKGGSFLGPGVGNVYYVIQTTNGDYTRFVRDMMFSYPDGSVSVYTGASGIQTALDACVDERNDYVIVMPDNADYDVGATLTMSKASVHLLCPAGMTGAKYGCGTRAATIDPNGAFHGITITGRGCEVAGFWIRGATEKYCITSDGVGVHIHHNDCAVTATTSAAGGIQVTSNGLGSHIENNFVFSNAGAGTWVFGIQVHPSCTRSHIISNAIVASNATTLTNAIDTTNINTNAGAGLFIVSDNFIQEAPAFGSSSASTISCGIRAGDSVGCDRNRVIITTGANALIGGTAGKYAVLNYESASGGTLAV